MNPSDILQDSAETYRQKNDDYGSSWYAIGEILYGLTHGEPITLETPEDFVSFGLFTRRLDKLARAFNGEFLGDDVNFEAVEDSHADESVYAAMQASLFSGDPNPDTPDTAIDPRYERAYQELRRK
jgi:hypothetical protein